MTLYDITAKQSVWLIEAEMAPAGAEAAQQLLDAALNEVQASA